MDEAVAGHASFIEVTLEAGNWLTVRDNGRGIPVDPHPKFKQSQRAGSHPDHAAFGRQIRRQGLRDLGRPARRRQFGGERAVGGAWRWRSRATACCGSRATRAASRPQAGERRRRCTTAAAPRSASSRTRRSSARSQFSPARLYRLCRSKAYLFRGVQIRWACDPRCCAAQGRHAGRGGAALPGRAARQPGRRRSASRRVVLPQPWAGEADLPRTAPDRPGRMGGRLAGGGRGLPPLLLQHHSDHPGRHARGRVPRRAAEGPARLGRAARQPPGRAGQCPRTCSAPMAAKLSVFLREPQFQGQTKEKLTSTEAARLVETALRDRFDHWLAGDPTQADNLLAFVIERAEERLRRRESKDTPRKSATRRLRLPGKLTDCTRENAGRDRDLPGRGRQRRRLGQAGAQPRDPGGAAAARQDPERRQRHRPTSCGRTRS